MGKTYSEPKLIVLELEREDIMAVSSNYFEDAREKLNIVDIADVMDIG